MSAVPRVVIAGTASGVGKTTVAVAIMAAYRRRGLTVQPFKIGPDYIDPSHHSLAAGRTSRNLDSFFLSERRLLECYGRAVQTADLAVIEGVMGLYDGRGVTDGEGSSAQVAGWLRAPVILVVDAAKMARSVAAVVLGFQQFDPSVRLAGVILNRLGSKRHGEWAAEAIERATGVPVVGRIMRSDGITLPERHLGLVLAGENNPPIDQLADLAERSVDLDRLLVIATDVDSLVLESPELYPVSDVPPRARIAIARDAAFAFYYEDNLDLLTAYGAQLVPFSPLEDAILPPDIGAVYLGGGYPELHSAALSANVSMRKAVFEAARHGLPVYAECGGLMYLAEGIVDTAGFRHEMVGLLPGWSTMRSGTVKLAYVEVEPCQNGLFLRAGCTLRGHEFHYSDHPLPSSSNAAYRMRIPEERLEGFAIGSVFASYVHLHLGVDAGLAPRFVALAEVAGKRPGNRL